MNRASMNRASMNSDGPGRHDNPWITHSIDTVYDNPWITVTHREVTTPTGTPGIYGHVHFKTRALAIVPIDEHDHTWLVGQYRYAADQYSWEIPEGGGALDEPPTDAARRELREECGLHADTLELIGTCELSNSVTDERAMIYVATDLRPVDHDPDETELLALQRVPVDEAIRMVLAGEITDALSQIALLLLARQRLDHA